MLGHILMGVKPSVAGDNKVPRFLTLPTLGPPAHVEVFSLLLFSLCIIIQNLHKTQKKKRETNSERVKYVKSGRASADVFGMSLRSWRDDR